MANSAKKKNGDIFQKIFRCYKAVEIAVRKKKLFNIGPGYFPAKQELCRRGWLELGRKGELNTLSLSINGGSIVNHNLRMLEKNLFHLFKTMALTALSQEVFEHLSHRLIPNYIWTPHRFGIKWKFLHEDQAVNKLPRAIFSSKNGLMQVSEKKQRICFVNDFRLTTSVNLLKSVVSARGTEATTNIPCSSIKMVINYVTAFINQKGPTNSEMALSESEFGPFFETAQAKRRTRKLTQLDEILREKCGELLKEVKKLFPQLPYDGSQNVWIAKPSNSTRGKGIVVLRDYNDIMDSNAARSHNYRKVLQKYIERPLLIYNTKFDIRQWFVITRTHPLVIWIYDDYYIRFSSQQYTLRSFHESVHLCNNAIQRKYFNGKRSHRLPLQNMWAKETFLDFLRSHNLGNHASVIDSGIKKAIIASICGSQHYLTRPFCRTFELFGADFLLTQDFRPMLLEINSNPALSRSTSVTAQMCKQLLKDIVILTTSQSQADPKMGKTIANFECIFTQRDTNNQAKLNDKKKANYDPKMLKVFYEQSTLARTRQRIQTWQSKRAKQNQKANNNRYFQSRPKTVPAVPKRNKDLEALLFDVPICDYAPRLKYYGCCCHLK